MNSTFRNYNCINYNLSITESNLSDSNSSFNYQYYIEYTTPHGWRVFSNQTNLSNISENSMLIPPKTRLIFLNNSCYAYIPSTSTRLTLPEYMSLRDVSQKYRSINRYHCTCLSLFVKQHKLSGPLFKTLKKSAQKIMVLVGKALC